MAREANSPTPPPSSHTKVIAGLYLWACRCWVISKLIPHHTHSGSFDQRETFPAQKVLSSICKNRKKNQIKKVQNNIRHPAGTPSLQGLVFCQTLKPESLRIFENFVISDEDILPFLAVFNFILNAVIYNFFLRLKLRVLAPSYYVLLSV